MVMSASQEETTALKKYNEKFIEHFADITIQAKSLTARFCPRIFEVDELINEAWIRGFNSNRPNKAQFLKRSYWDMQDYIREKMGRSVKKRDKLVANSVFEKDGKITNLFEIAACEEEFNRIDNRELLELLLKEISYLKLETIKYYFMEEKTLNEISKIYGVADNAICNRIREAKILMKNVAIKKKYI